jgi:hypothetical protein
MARVIRLGDIGDYANTQMEKLIRSAVTDTDTLLKSASPVDTGDFALAGKWVRMLLALTMLGHSKKLLAHTRTKPSRQASQRHLLYAE